MTLLVKKTLLNMTLNRKFKIEQVDRVTNYSVFGFIRKFEEKEKENVHMIIKHLVLKYLFIDLKERIKVKSTKVLICICGKDLKQTQIREDIRDCDICKKEMKTLELTWYCKSKSKQSMIIHGKQWYNHKSKYVSIGFDVCSKCRKDIIKQHTP